MLSDSKSTGGESLLDMISPSSINDSDLEGRVVLPSESDGDAIAIERLR